VLTVAAAAMASLEASAAAFFVRGSDELSSVHERQPDHDVEAIRGALAADDALRRQGLAVRFRVRETPDWRKHAADLESEMLKRGMRFEIIDWSEDQPTGVDSQIKTCADSLTQKAMGLGESPISHARRTVLCRENCADRWTTPRA
jgi:hypothetical protein